MARHHCLSLLAALAGLLGVTAADCAPAERPRRLEVWDLQLGSQAERLPDEFIDYACGTNGGPPGLPLTGFKDFRRCRADASGLREVYFRYDDELEYWGKANGMLDQIERFAGTKTYGFPIIASALFDAGGTLQGIRIVSDPRDDTQNREEAYFLRNFLTARFGRDGWQCEDQPLAEGETPVGGLFVKQSCRKAIDDRTDALLVTRFLRKPGQSQYDPHSGRETTGQFESSVRFELMRKTSR